MKKIVVRKKVVLLVVIATTLISVLAYAISLSLRINNLKCEFRTEPLGIEVEHPRLSWTLISDERGQKQTAYRILVASTTQDLESDKGNLWDSGRIESDQSLHIAYQGKTLASREQCFWKVKVWDKNARPSEWSDTASWTMGLLKPSDWRGEWIGTPRKRSLDYPGKGAVFGYRIGYHAKLTDASEEEQWIQMNLKASRKIDKIVLHPLLHDGDEGFGFPVRFRIEGSKDSDFTNPTIIADYTQSDFPNPGFWRQEFPADGIQASHIRLTVTRIWQRPHGDRKYCFALGEMQVMSGEDNLALNAEVLVKDSEENSGWSRENLTDGVRCAPDPRTEGLKGGQRDPGDAAVLMRKSLTLNKPVKRALACICGLGASELSVNGTKVSKDVFAPGFTDYTKRVLYMNYDVTNNLRIGENVIGVILGNGFYSLPSSVTLWCSWYFRETTIWGDWPKLLLDIEIEYEDGSTEVVVSDDSWKWSTGEITWNCLWTGEKHDARLAKPGWNSPGYDDEDWDSALVVKGPLGDMEARQSPPIRVYDSVAPIQVSGDTFTFDSMYSGWLKVKTHGEAGQKIIVQGGPPEEFILSGNGVEELEPKFTFHTIQPTVRVIGLTEEPTKDTLTLQRVGGDLEKAGDFRCSNEYFNKLYKTLVRTNQNYNYDHPMDPTREKTGWSQDVETMFDTAIYLTDAATMYRKWWRDMADNQDETGRPGPVMPYSGQFPRLNGPWWSGMIVLTPWLMVEYYEDMDLLREAYPAMKRYVEMLRSISKDNLVDWGLGDWNEAEVQGPPRRTPVVVTSTCGYFYHATILSRGAELLGNSEDTETYATLAEDIQKSFWEKLYDPTTGLIGGAKDSQTAFVLPLQVGLVPDERKREIIESLVENIHQRNDHLSTGFVGTPYLLTTLSDCGYGELAFRIANQRDFPSWSTLIRDNVFKKDWGGGNVQMPSCGGAIGRYFYHSLAGIQKDASTFGFKHFIIRPDIVGDLTWVKAYYDSPYGRIVSEWTRNDKALSMNIAIPANTTATVYVPSPEGQSVTEEGRPICDSEGVHFIRAEDGRTVLDVESGSYAFSAPLVN